MATNDDLNPNTVTSLGKAIGEAGITPLNTLAELEELKSLVSGLVQLQEVKSEPVAQASFLDIEALRKARNFREDALAAFKAAEADKDLVLKETKEMENKLWLISSKACSKALENAKKELQRIRSASFKSLKEATAALEKANAKLQEASGDPENVLGMIRSIWPGRDCWNRLKEVKEIVQMVAFRDRTVKQNLWQEYNSKKEFLAAAKADYDARWEQAPGRTQQNKPSAKPELTPEQLEERREKNRQKSERHKKNKKLRADQNRANAKGGSGAGGKKGKN